MSSELEIIKECVNEFRRVQEWMFMVKETSPDAYESMYNRYLDLKVILTSAGTDLTNIDRVEK